MYGIRTYKILIPHLRFSRVLTNRLIFRNEYRYSLSYHLYIRNVFLVDNSSFLLAILWITFIKSVLSSSPYYASIISIISSLSASTISSSSSYSPASIHISWFVVFVTSLLSVSVISPA